MLLLQNITELILEVLVLVFTFFLQFFFADVTKAWRLTPKQRVVIDLAGIYFELIYISLLLLIFLITKEVNFLLVSFILFIDIFYNLDPFLRTDGYWVVADGLKIPNLRKQSLAKLKVFLKKITNKSDVIFTKKDWFLVTYALTSLSFIVFFVAGILIWNADSVLYYPINVYQFTKGLFTSQINDWSLEKIATITLPTVFYYLLISITYKSLKKLKKNEH